MSPILLSAASRFAAPGFAIAGLLAATVVAQVPVLLRDVNQAAAPVRHSDPYGLFAFGGSWHFAANTPDAGYELYRSDGTPGGTLRIGDLEPGVLALELRSTRPSTFHVGLTRAYFFRNTLALGAELWQTDGTLAGTSLVKDLVPGPGSPSLSNTWGATLQNRFLFTTAENAPDATKLWISDGTAAGTVVLASAAGLVNTGPFVRFGSRVVFRWSEPTTGNELWTTDGTAGGTTRLLDLNPGPGDSNLFNIVVLGSQLVLVAQDAAHGRELWVTDGTTAGTHVVDLEPGAGSSNPGDCLLWGGHVVFRASTAGRGSEPWRTDGTGLGTTLIADISPGGAGSFPELYGVVGGRLVFSADDGTHGREVWATDGSAVGTTLLADFAPGPASLLPFYNDDLTPYVQVTGSRVVFRTPATLFGTDGTPAGTQSIRSFVGASLGEVRLLGPWANGQVLFSANEGVHGTEPWVTDGITTSLFLDIATEPVGGTQDSLTRLGVGGDRQFVWPSDDGVHGSELWRTDGSAAGSQLVVDLIPGAQSSDPYPAAPAGDAQLWAATDAAMGRELWRSDGTSMQLVKDIRPGPGSALTPMLPSVAFRDRAMFIANDGVNGYEPWVTDGTAAGTFMLRDTSPPSSIPILPNYLRAGSQVFFQVNGSLWGTDGTATGTRPVLSPGQIYSPMVLYQGRVYFTMFTASTGLELWSSDGTPGGTALFADIQPGTGSSLATPLGVWADRLWFTAGTPAAGTELWVSDGTVPGTRLVADIWPGTEGSFPQNFMAARDRAYFVAQSPSTGTEVYVMTPGNPPTVLRDIWPGPVRSQPIALSFQSSRYLWFTAADPAGGQELWRSDGTPGGTIRMTDIWPGPASSRALLLGPLGHSLFLYADDGVLGMEPWLLNPGAFTYDKGHPCGLGLREPDLEVDDPVLGNVMRIAVRDVMASSPGVLLFGLPGPAAPVGNGCLLYLSSPSTFALFATDAAGRWDMSLLLPNIPALTGLSAAFQAAVAAAPGITGIECTAASILVFGQ